MGLNFGYAVGTQRYPDGAGVQPFRLTNDGALVVSHHHGRLYEQAIRGNVFYAGTSDAGVVLNSVASGNVGAFYWNRANGAQPFMDEVYRIDVNMNAGAQVLGAFNWYGQPAAGSQQGTLAPIRIVATAGSIVNGLVALAPTKVPNMVCYVGATTWTAMPFLRVCRISMWAGAVATNTEPAWMLWEDYEGSFCVGPGGAIELFSTGTTTVEVTATIIETPTPGALV